MPIKLIRYQYQVRKIVIIFCLLIFVVQFFQIIYFQRSLFAEKYDAEYWKDRYEHSQYQLPLSKRIIGDEGLFAYSGYRIINGDNPFSINVDKPPVAKYLFGLSILLFHNPLHIVLLFGLATLIVFYFIAKQIFKNRSLALLVTTMLFLDPLFFSQFWVTALDLIQLFFLLLNILLLINIKKFRDWNIAVILGSGLSLGFFAEVKPPIILPVIFVLETLFLFYKCLRKEYLLFLLGLSLGIIMPYLRFIFLGNNIIEILRLHKYMASIYLQSQLKAHVGAVWLALLIGKFPNVVTGALINVSEWWILWPVIAFSGTLMAIFSLFAKRNIFNKGLAIFLLVTLMIFTFIPSYPRYLVVVLPFLYLFGINFIESFFHKGRLITYSILLFFGIINSFFFLLPKAETSLNGFYYNLSHLFLHDVYQESIADKDSLGLTRDQFRHVANKAFDGAKIRAIEVKELSKNVPMFAETGDLKIGVTYKTQDLGSFYEEKIIKLVNKDGKWKIKWDWNIIFDGFLPSYQMETQTVLGKRGSILDAKGNKLAWDDSSNLVLFNPSMMDNGREIEMLKLIERYGYKGDISIRNAYLENVLSGSYVPLVAFHTNIKNEEKNALLSYPGIKVINYPSRIYDGNINFESIGNTFYDECCTRIYSSYNYHGVKGIEKKYDSVLWGYSGGKISMKDSKGNIVKVVFEKDKKDGKDIILQ